MRCVFPALPSFGDSLCGLVPSWRESRLCGASDVIPICPVSLLTRNQGTGKGRTQACQERLLGDSLSTGKASRSRSPLPPPALPAAARHYGPTPPFLGVPGTRVQGRIAALQTPPDMRCCLARTPEASLSPL